MNLFSMHTKWLTISLLLLTSAVIMLHAQGTNTSTVQDTSSISAEDTAKVVQILHANELEFIVLKHKRKAYQTIDSIRIRKLIGEVHLRHDSTDMFCDSAYQYVDSNYIEAYSQVQFVNADSIRIFADKLRYDSEKKELDLYDNIKLTDRTVELLTDRLTYYRDEKYGAYYEGGTLKDTANTLTSIRGYYYPDQDLSLFKERVKLVNDDYILETDTLAYNTFTEVAYFHAPTLIYDEGSELYTENGYYDTRNEIAFLYDNPYAQDSIYKIEADTLYYNHRQDSGRANTNIRLTHKDQSLFIFGETGEFHQHPSKSFVTDSAFATQFMKEDTLFLVGDTLFAFKDSANNSEDVRAYPNVMIYMKDLQGISDSLVYSNSDSIFRFYKDPVLWSDANQLTGDTIFIWIKNEEADSMSVMRKAFLITKVDTIGFNQVKGKLLNVKFRNNELFKLNVQRNCESIYFTESEPGQYDGMNLARCNEMIVDFRENKPRKITFLDEPSGTYSPIFSVLGKQNELDGFTWRESERPERPARLLERALNWKKEPLPEDTLTILKGDTLRDTITSTTKGLKGRGLNSLLDSLEQVDTVSVRNDTSTSSGLGVRGRGTKTARDTSLSQSDTLLFAGESTDTLIAPTKLPREKKPRLSEAEKKEAKEKRKETKAEQREARKQEKRKRKQEKWIRKRKAKHERKQERLRKRRQGHPLEPTIRWL